MGSPPVQVLAVSEYQQLTTYFGEDVKAMPNTLFVLLGDKVAEALNSLASGSLLSPNRILDDLQHPSGANDEQIAYFLGKKWREDLSAKTNPSKSEAARKDMMVRSCTAHSRLSSLLATCWWPVCCMYKKCS